MLNQLKEDIKKESKRCLKKDLPKSKVVLKEIEDNLIRLFNNLTSRVTTKQEDSEIFEYCRRKIVLSFSALQVRYVVPRLHGIPIQQEALLADEESYSTYTELSSESEDEQDTKYETQIKSLQKEKQEVEKELQRLKTVIEELQKTDDSEIADYKKQLLSLQEDKTKAEKELVRLQDTLKQVKEQNNPKMTQTKLEIAKFVNSEITEYDGSFQGYTTFKNQVIVVKDICDAANVTFALSAVKARIKNGSLAIKISQAQTFDELLNIVEANSERKTTHSYKEELKSLKVNNSWPMYVNKLRDTSKKLLETYLSEGTSLQYAEKYVKESLIEVIKEATTDHAFKTAISLNNFDTVEDIFTKILNAKPAKEENVFFARSRGANARQQRGHWRQNSSRGQHYKSGNYGNRNFRRGRGRNWQVNNEWQPNWQPTGNRSWTPNRNWQNRQQHQRSNNNTGVNGTVNTVQAEPKNGESAAEGYWHSI